MNIHHEYAYKELREAMGLKPQEEKTEAKPVSELEAIISELEASKLEGKNKFKEAYNTGIDVAIGVVERWQNIFKNCIERGNDEQKAKEKT